MHFQSEVWKELKNLLGNEETKTVRNGWKTKSNNKQQFILLCFGYLTGVSTFFLLSYRSGYILSMLLTGRGRWIDLIYGIRTDAVESEPSLSGYVKDLKEVKFMITQEINLCWKVIKWKRSESQTNNFWRGVRQFSSFHLNDNKGYAHNCKEPSNDPS